MKQQFTQYLEDKGYKTRTPAGHRSTVYDYAKRIENVCDWEHPTWEGLAKDINKIIKKYGN